MLQLYYNRLLKFRSACRAAQSDSDPLAGAVAALAAHITEPQRIIDMIVHVAKDIGNADRCALFIVDPLKEQLWGHVSEVWTAAGPGRCSHWIWDGTVVGRVLRAMLRPARAAKFFSSRPGILVQNPRRRALQAPEVLEAKFWQFQIFLEGLRWVTVFIQCVFKVLRIYGEFKYA